jgi:flavin reductase (DIM6/NTAB) family NADH-FMN oxidoreductase RutF
MKPQALLVPLPATMLSCQKEGEKPNVITLSWVGVVCSEPPVIGVGIRPSRFSHHIVKDSGEFVINLPSEDQLWQTDYCGHVSGRDTDKFPKCGFTPARGLRVKAPAIEECPVNIECRVIRSMMLGSHELFLGEIVAIQIDESCIDEKGEINIAGVKPFVYVPGSRDYVGGINSVIGQGGFSLKGK